VMKIQFVWLMSTELQWYLLEYVILNIKNEVST
jgi:hypothetical protein